jgi:hypothetical protein
MTVTDYTLKADKVKSFEGKNCTFQIAQVKQRAGTGGKVYHVKCRA